MVFMEASAKNYFKMFFKFFLALFLCLLVRLIPLRAPNVEPIFATLMPFSKAYGAVVGFSFAVLSILLFDVVTGTLGAQTFFTVTAYGMLGLASAYYFEKRKAEKWAFARFAIFGTLFFDAFTGLTVGPIFFHQSFVQSLVGQVPFTALHLAGNITFALVLSPAIYNFLIRKKDLVSISSLKEKQPLISILNPKAI
jgi:uncharacterized membrane protein YuzA (DUF378 family)